jgi:predicted mannosyl-3-phosphoglycerate phosphatase (HAD superfamily)
MTALAGTTARAFLLQAEPRLPPRPLLLSDVDDTLLDANTPWREVRAGFAAAARHVEVVLASSRTVEELIHLLHELNAEADLIAENGACIAVRSPAVARSLGARETLTRRGRRWYVASRGASSGEVRASVQQARAEHGAQFRVSSELSSRRRTELLGNPSIARLALSRRCSVLVEPPTADPASDACLAALRKSGYHAALGGPWLTIWRGPHHGDAALAYLAAQRDNGHRATAVAAVGDAANDAPLLRAASTRFAVLGPDGRHDPSLLEIPGIIPLERGGHAGWREAVARLGYGAVARRSRSRPTVCTSESGVNGF